MRRRVRIWWVLLWVLLVLFLVVNVAGAGIAAADAEPWHAALHAALALLAACGAWWLRPGRAPAAPIADAPRSAPPVAGADAPRGLADRLSHIEQSVDTVAVEVERIGEGQRFLMRVLADPATGVAAPAPAALTPPAPASRAPADAG